MWQAKSKLCACGKLQTSYGKLKTSYAHMANYKQVMCMWQTESKLCAYCKLQASYGNTEITKKPMRYPSREARSANFLYSLREPPADPPNTIFNGAIQNTSRTFFIIHPRASRRPAQDYF